MYRKCGVIFCGNEHGCGDVTFPSLEEMSVFDLQQRFIDPPRGIAVEAGVESGRMEESDRRGLLSAVRGEWIMMAPEYEATGDELTKRILALIPSHPEIMTIKSPFELFGIDGFKCADLGPSLAQAGWALGKARHLHNAHALAEERSDDSQQRVVGPEVNHGTV